MDTASFKEYADDLGSRVRPKIDEVKQRVGRINGQMTTFIQDHPIACLLGAVGMGYLVARLARRQH
jgi:hypothetical protein